jgi:hypothetical protein
MMLFDLTDIYKDGYKFTKEVTKGEAKNLFNMLVVQHQRGPKQTVRHHLGKL